MRAPGPLPVLQTRTHARVLVLVVGVIDSCPRSGLVMKMMVDPVGQASVHVRMRGGCFPAAGS